MTAGGTLRRARVRPVAIADLLYDADYAPALRAGVPAAVRAGLAGDAAPLLRLLRISAGFAFPSAPQDFSAARYATVCEETPLPWPRGTPVADRLRVAREGAAALGPAAFFPFDADVAFADEIELCLRWPDPGRPPRAGGRRLPGRAGAAAAGGGGPADAAGVLGPHRVAAPALDARDRARRRPRRGRGRSRATAASGSCGAGWPAGACGRGARAWRPACRP